MADGETAERITITLSGSLLGFVENKARELCVGKDVIVQLAVHEMYNPSVPLGQVLDVLKHS